MIRRPHGTVLDMAGLGRRSVGVDVVDVAAGWSDPRGDPSTNGSARLCSTGNWWSRADCRHCVGVTDEAVEPPQEKINILEKTLAVMGNEEPISAGRKLLEKELGTRRNSRVRRTLQSRQRRNNIGSTGRPRASKTEVGKLVEMQ